MTYSSQSHLCQARKQVTWLLIYLLYLRGFLKYSDPVSNARRRYHQFRKRRECSYKAKISIWQNLSYFLCIPFSPAFPQIRDCLSQIWSFPSVFSPVWPSCKRKLWLVHRPWRSPIVHRPIVLSCAEVTSLNMEGIHSQVRNRSSYKCFAFHIPVHRVLLRNCYHVTHMTSNQCQYSFKATESAASPNSCHPDTNLSSTASTSLPLAKTIPQQYRLKSNRSIASVTSGYFVARPTQRSDKNACKPHCHRRSWCASESSGRTFLLSCLANPFCSSAFGSWSKMTHPRRSGRGSRQWAS